MREHLPEPAIEKNAFSCCGSDAFNARLRELKARSFVVAGMEAHVCILQTVLDLLGRGYHVHVAGDAVISRRTFAWKTALNMMAQAGAAVTTTETVLFQLMGRADIPEFKAVSQLIKEEP